MIYNYGHQIRLKKGDIKMSKEQSLKICMISGSFEYDSEKSLILFSDYLENKYSVERNIVLDTKLIIYKSEDDHQSLKQIEDADMTLVFTRRLNTKGEELERFKKYCIEGKPIVGVRTASHAYQNWLIFDKKVLGGNYQGHYGPGPIAKVEINESAKNHPILKGVSNFKSHGSLYQNTPISQDTTILLTGKTTEHTEPVAWTRLNNGGRVFYTSLGHQKDFEEENFLRLLANAVVWTASR
jgi:type 1 glutamine amidotransferase